LAQKQQPRRFLDSTVGDTALIALRSTPASGRGGPILGFLLGLWLGGSIIVGAVAAFNFGGFDEMFQRNPNLAAHAGFSVSDEAAKKASLLWVHASELNRVFFERWNRTQLVLGTVTVLLALRIRAGRTVTALLLSTLVLVALLHLLAEPRIVELGRQLDFAPRVPSPAGLAEFQQLHGIYFGMEALRLLLLGIATAMILVRKPG